MTRYSVEQKESTRERILKAAAKEFRSKGWAGATVPGIMEAAGLTAGGFYKHFDSKSSLFAEMFRETLRKSIDKAQVLKGRVPEGHWWEALARTYLDPAHRDNYRGGCVMAALASDMPRAESAAKQACEEELLRYVEVLAQSDDETTDEARSKAWAFQALLLGGLIMSRGVESDATAQEILEACQQAAGDLATH